MNPPKRHHWVPQFYLKWFATPESAAGKNPQVNIFHRKTGEPLATSVRNIAVEKYLYAPLADNGPGERDFSREIDLAELDDLLSQIWPTLACGFADLSSQPLRKGISLYLATLFLRHPYSFARQRESRNELIQIIERAPKDRDGLPDLEWIEIGSDKRRVLFDKTQWHTLKNNDYNNEHQFFVDMIRTSAIDISEGLMRKRWSMVFMDEPLIVTSDNPFFVMDPDKKRDQILGPGVKLMFPVSPTRILCFDDLNEPRNQYYNVPSNQAGLYNFMTWVNTDDFLISPRDIDQVLQEIDEMRQQFESAQKEDVRA